MILEKTVVLKVNPSLSDKKDIENLTFAADVLKKGGLVAFPTETVYGLGANALDEKAVENIFLAKGRAQDNPLIVHLSSSSDADIYAHTCLCEKASLLLKEMPSPLTVIMPKRQLIPMVVTAGLENVALRVPQNPIARKLIELSGVPVAAPSANLSGKPSPTRAKHVIEDMTGRADVIIDGGDCSVGLESTVVSLCTCPPTLLRPGGFSYERLCEILGEVDIADAVLSQLKEGQVPQSPGMKYKHYAPDTRVVLVKGSEKNIKAFLEKKYNNPKNAIICYDEDIDKDGDRAIKIGSRKDNSVYAERMFDSLRKLDCVEGISTAYAVLPADTSGISLAIYNRMLRAASFNVINADEELACSGKMLVVGLTGQSGAGKGELGKIFACQSGVKVIDTDLVARQVVRKGKPCLDELCRFFGDEILNDDGTLNRQKLASIAFCDKEKHTRLNSITHAHIMREVEDWLESCRENNVKCAVIDAPLLFESGADALCDVTVGVISSYEKRLERVMRRDGIDEKNAGIRLDSQPDNSFFTEKCSYIIENNSSLDQFYDSCKKLVTQLLDNNR